ncbi:HEPN domain-containing protein [Thalassovita sp.]|uniref:HEPN domain-containing protein n=1 Tax=Thalassovita sp. TaxID=1979401 RepID=UPI002B2791A5|nr:HEPN domain-containing protein [Thalassovita sp.]
MRNCQINLANVDDLIEARIRFHLFEQKMTEAVPDWERDGKAIVQAGIVLLSASFQAFVEDVFLECSEKAFGKMLSGKNLKNYRETWRNWGNPNPDNIVRLFRRLGCDDVFENLSLRDPTKEDFLKTLVTLNSARNCIAHGKPTKHSGKRLDVNLAGLREWRRQIDVGSRAFRVCAMRQSGI